MNPATALFAGDVSLDLTMTIDHVPEPDEKVHAEKATEAPGGVTANAAMACLRAGTLSRLAITVGEDAAGRMLVADLRSAGLDVAAATGDGASCRVVSLLEPHGEKRLILHPGVSMYPTQRLLADLSLDDIGWVHTAVYDIEAAQLLIDRCRERVIPWSLDLEPSTFPQGIDSLRGLIAGAAVVFCNARAIAAIGVNAIDKLSAMGAKAVIRTRGRDGATLYRAQGNFDTVAPRGPVVDTTGAGDCLAGWFVAERLAGASDEQALKTAVIAATLSCARLGSQSSYPSRQDVEGLCFQPANRETS